MNGMIKRLFFLTLCLIVVIIPTRTVHAQDVFPEFTTSLTTIHIPIDVLQGYHEDPGHEVGAYVAYTVNGQFFTDPAQGHLQTLAEGFSGTSDRSTPWKTLTELLAAYQTTDIDAIRALYTAASQVALDGLLTDPETQVRFMNFMGAIAGMDVLLGFDHKNGFLAIVNIHYSGESQTDLMPFFFVQAGSAYLLSSVVLDEAIDSNTVVFLQQDHTVEDLLKPLDPQHTLTVEKDGAGDGIVVGSGIDCGSDCIEIYREGTMIFLKAIPDADSVFDKWLVNGGPVQGRIEIHQDTIVTAIFNSK